MQSTTALPSGQSNKLFYIDNIKILLTVLVVLHHLFIAYGASGGWYYMQKTTHIGALVPMTMFVSTNQSFFMGFFFLLSAYFTGPSYDRKGAGQFIADRLLRLGIPLLFYSFILSPFISYLVYYFAKGHHITYLQYLSGYDTWIDPGVMWFVAALLIFTLIYVAVRSLVKITFKKSLQIPGIGAILLFAVVLGIISFLARIMFPGGWVLKPLGFQLGHFPQYIALFIVGLLAYQNQWFDGLSERTGKHLKWSAWLCLLFFPVFFIIRVKLNMPVAWYSGGFHWQSLLYAVWEQWIGLSILTALLSSGKRSWNTSSPLFGKLSRCSFAVYLFHPLVIVALTLAVRNWAVDPTIKLLLVAPLAVLGSFLLGTFILLIPGVKRII
ncbi:surface polysaccharide O-acyltransferase-like enzyme [Mucilaginibacter gracilis]|uniref:Surface polysaccharide O-acyltransferase-like enzyme n=1 Tax=Mucilaginibacter gracilis TaxID=423350 RepID=A0A495IUC7_9SPHI|nr:acyltransferase [Mucilaginibacter gracilis]RKR80356.1 surface polysaccharide O-acyltransferase-like enzyme [Mucilaginibacter gracilis]